MNTLPHPRNLAAKALHRPAWSRTGFYALHLLRRFREALSANKRVHLLLEEERRKTAELQAKLNTYAGACSFHDPHGRLIRYQIQVEERLLHGPHREVALRDVQNRLLRELQKHL